MSQQGTPPPFPIPDNMSGNFEQGMRWMQQLWGGSGDAATAMRMPGAAMASLRPEEFERKIAELRSVERWLELHLSVLRTTIQTMEMQRSAMAAWQSMTASATAGAPGQAASGAPDPATAFQPTAWWNAMQDQFTKLAAAAGNPPAAEAPGATAGGPQAGAARPPGRAAKG
jgi:hypothetical protein